MVIWNSFPDKSIVKSEQKQALSRQAICYKLEKRRADFFEDYAICFNLVHLCPSILCFFYIFQQF